eukprot:5484787-Amphidinium_carterae.1
MVAEPCFETGVLTLADQESAAEPTSLKRHSADGEPYRWLPRGAYMLASSMANVKQRAQQLNALQQELQTQHQRMQLVEAENA